MLGSMIKFFLGLGLTGTVAVTVATTVYNYYQQNGTSDGSGWVLPASISGVPEINAGQWVTLGLMLAGGLALITAARPMPNPTHSNPAAADNTASGGM